MLLDGQNLAVPQQEGKPVRSPGFRTTRMEAFSDGVFAIAITLLVLEIGVPSGSASALVSLLWRYAVRERLIRTDIADTDVKMITKRLAPGLAGYVAMIVLGLFLPVVAVLGYLVIAVYIIVPIGALRRRSAAA
jgi:Endosomal/lysosomal potassium channel TMEM175